MWKRINKFVADIGPITLIVVQTDEELWAIDADFQGVDPVFPPRERFRTAEHAQRAAIEWAESIISQRCAEVRDWTFAGDRVRAAFG